MFRAKVLLDKPSALKGVAFSSPGYISTVIKWLRPRDDGDAVVSGYQVFVDGIRHGKILSQWTLQANVKVIFENNPRFCCA